MVRSLGACRCAIVLGLLIICCLWDVSYQESGVTPPAAPIFYSFFCGEGQTRGHTRAYGFAVLLAVCSAILSNAEIAAKAINIKLLLDVMS